MPQATPSASRPADLPADTRSKLAALWTSTTLCYLYCDYLALYAPGKLQGMLQGQMGPLGAVTPGVLLGTSAFMAIPCLMVAISLVASPRLNRWANIGAGVLFTAIMALILPGRWGFYQLWGALEMLLTLTIVVLAMRWPRVPVDSVEPKMSVAKSASPDRTY